MKPATTAYTQILKPKQMARCADLQDVPKQRRLKIKQVTTLAATNATKANLTRQQPTRWKNGARNLKNGATKGNDEMRILALFDDGNGSVKKALPEHDVVSVGIGNADIVMDLSDLKNIKKLVDMHKENPFDLLMASPPCESWSFATAGDNGNAYRCKETLRLRTFDDWKRHPYTSIKRLVDRNAPEIPEIYSRYLKGGVNGDLTALFVCELVKALEIPFVIENPQSSMLFEKLKREGLDFVKNTACYAAYSEEFPLKRTGFASNVGMNLKKTNKAKFAFQDWKGNRGIVRSSIPSDLIKDIVSYF